MKRFIPGMALLFVLSFIAFADEKAATGEKPTLESECRAIAESHGIAADKLDDWMKRCKERTMDMQRKMVEENKANGMDSMGHDNMGDVHGKNKEENK